MHPNIYLAKPIAKRNTVLYYTLNYIFYKRTSHKIIFGKFCAAARKENPQIIITYNIYLNVNRYVL